MKSSHKRSKSVAALNESDDDEATGTMSSQHKWSKSTATTISEACKHQPTAGKGMEGIATEVGGIKEVLCDFLNPSSSIEQEKCAPAIKAIQENEILSRSNYGDLMLLLTDKHEVGSIYLTIDDPKDHMCYLEKQLECYCKSL